MQIPDDLPPPGTERLRLALDARLGLLAVADRLRQQWTSHAVAVGLSTAQVRVLLLLKPGDAIPMRALAAQLDYDASNLSSLVDRLESRGLVERHADPADRRVRALALTAEGARLRASFWRGLTEDLSVVGPLSTADLKTLTTLLSAVQELFFSITAVAIPPATPRGTRRGWPRAPATTRPAGPVTAMRRYWPGGPTTTGPGCSRRARRRTGCRWRCRSPTCPRPPTRSACPTLARTR